MYLEMWPSPAALRGMSPPAEGGCRMSASPDAAGFLPSWLLIAFIPFEGST